MQVCHIEGRPHNQSCCYVIPEIEDSERIVNDTGTAERAQRDHML